MNAEMDKSQNECRNGQIPPKNINPIFPKPTINQTTVLLGPILRED
jgi:hypothetical protein